MTDKVDYQDTDELIDLITKSESMRDLSPIGLPSKFVASLPVESYETTSENVVAFELLSKDVMAKANIVGVPSELLEYVYGNLSFKAFYNPINPEFDVNEFGNKFLSWFLAKGREDAIELRSLVTKYNNICLAISILDKYDGLQLAYHEILHQIFNKALNEEDVGIRHVVLNMFKSFDELPLEKTINIRKILLNLWYKPERISEEFWVYYLTLLIFPSKSPNEEVQEILKLGELEEIKSKVNQISFLFDNSIIDLIKNKVKVAKKIDF